MPYFKMGANPIGINQATKATLIDSEVEAFRPLIDLLKVKLD